MLLVINIISKIVAKNRFRKIINVSDYNKFLAILYALDQVNSTYICDLNIINAFI